MLNQITNQVMMHYLLTNELFPELNGEHHQHKYHLMKKIVEVFTNLRLFHYGKQFTLRRAFSNTVSRRHELNKLVLFLHQ